MAIIINGHVLRVVINMFLPFTATKVIYKDKDEKELGSLRVRYRVTDISHYQEWQSGTIIYIDGNKFYAKESVQELDAIVLGANPNTAKILYGSNGS